MKKIAFSLLLLSSLFSGSAYAVVFNGAEPMGDSELSETRGGFVTSTGMIIDFGLSNEIIIDGNVVSQITFLEQQMKDLQPTDYQKKVEVTHDGVSVSSLNLPNIPAVVNVIQNNVDNKLIQNFTLLDLNVSNLEAYKIVTLTPLLNYNNTLGVK